LEERLRNSISKRGTYDCKVKLYRFRDRSRDRWQSHCLINRLWVISGELGRFFSFFPSLTIRRTKVRCCSLRSGDLNACIKDVTGEDFSAKDFRTWAGTVLAALALSEFKKYDSQVEAKRNVVAAIESVSKQLGNTPAICRNCYVHPEVLDAYMSGDLVKMIEAKIAQKFKRQYAKLTSDEVMVMAFLRKRLDALKAAA